jgi:hypothetical protein
MADLKTALENACVANGWALIDGILSRSTSFFQVTSEASRVIVKAGTGQTGTTLDGQPTAYGVCVINYLGTTWTYPVDYEIHNFTDTDEVYFIVSYNSGFYQHLNFGKSDVPGIGGTGAWLTGSYGSFLTSINSGHGIAIYTISSQIGANSSGLEGGLFFGSSVSYPSHHIHTGLDTTDWKRSKSGVGNILGPSWAAGLLVSLPNLSNQANVLVPIKAIQVRNAGGRTIVANLKNSRYLRIDYINPGDIITFGAEEWQVYPVFRKDAAVRNGVSANAGAASHSGTFGYAIKYTGP